MSSGPRESGFAALMSFSMETRVMSGTCLALQRALRMHEVSGLSAGIKMGTLGEHRSTASYLQFQNAKSLEIGKFGNLSGSKTWPDLALSDLN